MRVILIHSGIKRKDGIEEVRFELKNENVGREKRKGSVFSEECK